MHLERKLFVASVFLFLLIIGASAIVGQRGIVPADALENSAVLSVGSSKVEVEVVAHEESRARGLGGREKLDSGSGMLFIFDTEDLWGIWMKDMKISIDVIWLDRAGKIVSVEENMSPDTYPKIFFPTRRSRYVLELPNGAFRASGASLDSSIDLSSVLLVAPK